ncbi:MAG: hypothetical protein LH465_00855 [Sphingomonas bacterium]|nr:hypothetical protein [Sphingomonas bacterium]
MRCSLLLIPTLLIAAPALAAPGPVKPAAPIAIPPILSDPAMADQLGRVAGVLTKSLMDLPVGEMEAAIEGRPATRADRARTVRDNIGGPEVEQQVTAQAAASGRMMQTAGKALIASLPAIMKSLETAREEIERATANLPSPTYPKR